MRTISQIAASEIAKAYQDIELAEKAIEWIKPESQLTGMDVASLRLYIESLIYNNREQVVSWLTDWIDQCNQKIIRLSEMELTRKAEE